MPRKIVPIITNTPYHISARCVNQEWFSLPLDTVWNIMNDYLYLMVHGFDLRIHAFVLMSNHFHLLATPTSDNLSDALLYFMRETSREITRLSGRINQTYGIRNHKTLIGSYHYFMNSYKYIYRNPVRAKICERVEDYPYSTLHGLIGKRHLSIPVDEDTILFDNFNGTLDWLNQPSDPEAEECVRRALRRSTFKFTKDKKGRPIRWETELL